MIPTILSPAIKKMDDWDETISALPSMTAAPAKGFGSGQAKGFGRGVLRQNNSTNSAPTVGFGKFQEGAVDGNDNKFNGFGESPHKVNGKRGGFGSKSEENGDSSFGNKRGINGNGDNSESDRNGGFGSKGGFGEGGFGGDKPPRGGGFASADSGDTKSGFGQFRGKTAGFGSGKGAGGDKNCFKCGESGHFSRECPSAGSGNNKGGSGDKSCFKCGESGHFSRECPSAGSGIGRSGGGDKNCFKCGEAGHFSRECPKAGEAGEGGLTLDKSRPPPYIPPAPSEEEEEIFKSIQKGINFDNFDLIPVEVTGKDAPNYKCIQTFEEAGLCETFLANVKKAGYEKPTPVQKYAIPVVMGGRDLMACAQTGSGKTAAFLLPVLTGMVRNGLTGSSFSAMQEPQCLVLAPTRELAIQINLDSRKFAHSTMIRTVVLYGGTSVGYQMGQLDKGCHILVATPGRLSDVLGKGKLSLEKIRYLVLDEADRMLDMGFGPEIRKIVENFGMPQKADRQTLMFSATFPEEIQKLAGEYLNDYLFLSVGVVGGANTDVVQNVFEVDRISKRDKLVEILTDSGTDKTLVFVEQKRNADFLASYLSQTGFPTTSIHGDRLQREREEALADFKTGRAPILIATSVAARGLDIPSVKHVINYDLPQSIEDYVHRIGRTGRCGNIGKATSFYSHDSDAGMAKALVRIFTQALQIVPDWLNNYAKESVSTAGYIPMAGKFSGKDIRKGMPRTRNEGEKQTFSGGFNGGFGGGMGGGGSSALGNGAEDDESWD